MSTNYAQYTSLLLSHVPGLPILQAQDIVNKAYRDIRDSRLWSFMLTSGAIICPALVNSGTVSVTQYSATVTADATAKAALNSIPAVTPITLQQFRAPNGPVYSISNYNSVTGVITLDRVYLETTNATASYQVYQCYFAAPGSNFRRWRSIFDPVNAYPLNLNFTKADFDRVDPQRGALGNPYYVGAFQNNSSGVPLYEFWPHPQSAIGYLYEAETDGTDFSASTDTLPRSIPDEVLAERALYQACLWAAGQKDLQYVNWLSLAQQRDGAYQAALKKAKLMDEEKVPMMVTRMPQDYLGIGVTFPNTGSFLASHDGTGVAM